MTESRMYVFMPIRNTYADTNLKIKYNGSINLNLVILLILFIMNQLLIDRTTLNLVM